MGVFVFSNDSKGRPESPHSNAFIIKRRQVCLMARKYWIKWETMVGYFGIGELISPFVFMRL